jgi:hypothetical protein
MYPLHTWLSYGVAYTLHRIVQLGVTHNEY